MPSTSDAAILAAEIAAVGRWDPQLRPWLARAAAHQLFPQVLVAWSRRASPIGMWADDVTDEVPLDADRRQLVETTLVLAEVWDLWDQPLEGFESLVLEVSAQGPAMLDLAAGMLRSGLDPAKVLTEPDNALNAYLVRRALDI